MSDNPCGAYSICYHFKRHKHIKIYIAQLSSLMYYLGLITMIIHHTNEQLTQEIPHPS